MLKKHLCINALNVRLIVDEQAVCDVCQHPLNLSTPMIEAIKSTAGVKNVDSGVSNETLEKGVIKRVNKESKKEDK